MREYVKHNSRSTQRSARAIKWLKEAIQWILKLFPVSGSSHIRSQFYLSIQIYRIESKSCAVKWIRKTVIKCNCFENRMRLRIDPLIINWYWTNLATVFRYQRLIFNLRLVTIVHCTRNHKCHWPKRTEPNRSRICFGTIAVTYATIMLI